MSPVQLVTSVPKSADPLRNRAKMVSTLLAPRMPVPHALLGGSVPRKLRPAACAPLDTGPRGPPLHAVSALLAFPATTLPTPLKYVRRVPGHGGNRQLVLPVLRAISVQRGLRPPMYLSACAQRGISVQPALLPPLRAPLAPTGWWSAAYRKGPLVGLAPRASTAPRAQPISACSCYVMLGDTVSGAPTTPPTARQAGTTLTGVPSR